MENSGTLTSVRSGLNSSRVQKAGEPRIPLHSRRLLNLVVWVSRVSLGCVLLASGIPKVLRPTDFLSVIYSYQLVGPQLGVLVAILVPWLELITAICLLGGVFIGGSFLLCSGLGVIFTMAQASALWRGLSIVCGCFSMTSSDSMVSYGTVTRALAILVTAVFAYLCWLAKTSNPERAGGQGAYRCE